MKDKIELLLNEKVRPGLSLHQGGIEIVSYQHGILTVKLSGQCSGCPFAGQSTLEFVRQTVQESFPEVTDVILLSGVSSGLIDQARKILAGEKII